MPSKYLTEVRRRSVGALQLAHIHRSSSAPCAGQERTRRLSIQAERTRQGAHGAGIWPEALAAFESGDGSFAQSSTLGEFDLSQARGSSIGAK
jgi:hypothetical protein